MSVTQLVRTIGDRDNQFHRNALAGNAMEFPAPGTRWVRLVNGADSTPAWSTNQANTFIIVYRSVVNSLGNDTGSIARTILSNGSFFARAGNVINTGYRFVVGGDVYDKFGIDNIVTDFQRSQNSPSTFVQPKRQVYIWQDPGGLNTNNKNCNYHGRNIPQGTFLSNLTVQTRPAGAPIGIGRYPSRDNNPATLYPFTNTFQGWIRSIEIIVGRNLTNDQVRAVFNYGTAHAAGVTTANDISIDFNRINGQAPICRTGTRQLTVECYNGTVLDTAGTTYADFYSL